MGFKGGFEWVKGGSHGVRMGFKGGVKGVRKGFKGGLKGVISLLLLNISR